MKKIFLFLLPAFLLLSCNKETDRALDIAGSYNYTRVGSASVVVNGQYTTLPISHAGTATISRTGTNRVNVSLGGDTYSGQITDDHIEFSPYLVESHESGVDMAMTINASGDISGTTINVMESYSGTAYVQGYAFPITGNGSLVLRKI